MPNIQINIKDKVARADRVIIVCDNSDYTAVFDFDDEWSAYETKTARFVYGGTYTDVVFTGNSCPIPEIHDTRSLTIGVYAGDLHTTTPAYISCVPSILCGNGIPADPTPDVYAQIMELLNKDSGVWYPTVDDAGNMSWTRSMSETEPQPVNIKGPKGDAGADGIGIPGADGKDGVDGKSAYELAQDNGFVGTMQEWLASLVGADGTNGVDGKDGISPAVSVAAITGGNRITITDAEGAKTFDVMDGAQGASGADGKDYVLTDTDKQEIAKTAAGLVDVPSVQPDWNQNDSTQPDYVKNRPFYAGNPVETVLVEESTVSFTNPSASFYYAAIPTTIELTAGETYKVSWDGTAYECVCESIMGYAVIGNPSIMGVGADTGDPFVITPLADGNGTEIYTLDTSASHTFSISEFAAAEVIKIPDKYISDTFRDIIIAGHPKAWSSDEWTKYYNLFQNGKLLKISGSTIDFNGYALSMADSTVRRILTITGQGNIYSSSVNSYTGDFYWVPIYTGKGLYLRYLQTGSYANEYDREEYAMLDAMSGELKFITKNHNEDEVSRRVVLYGDRELVLKSSTANSTKNFKITVDDSGEPTITDESDSTNTWKPTNLPTVTASDAGKFLRVSDTGEWVAETILSASGVSF